MTATCIRQRCKRELVCSSILWRNLTPPTMANPMHATPYQSNMESILDRQAAAFSELQISAASTKMFIAREKTFRFLEDFDTRLEPILQKQVPEFKDAVWCAQHYASFVCDKSRIELRVPRCDPDEPANISHANLSVPAGLLVVRAPTLYARHLLQAAVTPQATPQAARQCILPKTTLAAAQILVYWLFTGRMPKAGKTPRVDEDVMERLTKAFHEASASIPGAKVIFEPYLKEVNEEELAQDERITSLLRPWLEAWVLGQDCHIKEFQRLVMAKIKRIIDTGVRKHSTTMPPSNDDLGLLTIDDLHYVQSTAAELDKPGWNCLKTVIHVSLQKFVRRGIISMEDFNNFLIGDGVEESMMKTMDWLLSGDEGCPAQ